jgi:hypothetical protein
VEGALAPECRFITVETLERAVVEVCEPQEAAGQALAEWRHGELQRQIPRRMSEPRMVPITRRSESDHRSTVALQRSAAAFEPRLSHAERVRRTARATSARFSNGPVRCGTWGLRWAPGQNFRNNRRGKVSC